MDETTNTPGRSIEARGERKAWRRPTLERLGANRAMSSKNATLQDGSDTVTNLMS